MENHDHKPQRAEWSQGDSAGLSGRTRHLPASTQDTLLDSRPLQSDLPSHQDRNHNEDSSEGDLHLIQNFQALDQYPGSGNPRRLKQAQTAFSANSEVIVTTPHRTAWMDGNPFTAAQNGEAFAIENQDQERTPRLTLGSIDAAQIGAKEAARRHLLQWDRIYEYHEMKNPSSLELVAKHRSEAKREYEELLVSERGEDSLPKNDLPSHQNERIQARTALLLKTLLETSEEGCEPMKVNITAALKGYSIGTIGFSRNYTLIYAGHIVNTTCATYSEFTIDRQERLDQYLKEYGPGYLWWEPPLANGRERVLAKKSTVLSLDREDEDFSVDHHKVHRFQDDACHYKVPLGFKKDDSIRHRMRSPGSTSVVAKETRPSSGLSGKRKRESTAKENQQSEISKRELLTIRGENLGRREIAEETHSSICDSQEDAVAPIAISVTHESLQQNDCPTIFFDTLLDSGAELPVLLHDDFELLGYSKQDMNAASVVELNAAAGQSSNALCFELRVGLELDGSPSESWIDRVAYSEARFFPCRVIKLPPTVETPKHGAFSADRLSGMLPFLAYYMASAPGNGRFCLGEKRAEVLSTENLPAGLTYDPFHGLSKASRVKRQQQIAKIRKLGGETQGLRKVTFETALEGGRKLIDEDIVGERSHKISSNISITSKHGDLIDAWNLDCRKSSKTR